MRTVGGLAEPHHLGAGGHPVQGAQVAVGAAGFDGPQGWAARSRAVTTGPSPPLSRR
ncbi:hypothetical protein [Streptomyces sp. MMG1121]|uniref:hypothetical protein n=1 Tax=Streptomyces sp. MMG1121 TaxID=1415544 RepID=UPI001F3A83E1|nr:hypothetical protein [Streptomyces sp. MMG1121]